MKMLRSRTREALAPFMQDDRCGNCYKIHVACASTNMGNSMCTHVNLKSGRPIETCLGARDVD